MIFRGLQAGTLDWEFGNGLGSYAAGRSAIALNVQTALQTFLGDAFWAATFGVDWLNLLGQRGSENAILAQTRAIIANCQGVTAINSVAYALNTKTRTLSLQYNISTIFSTNTAGMAQITI